MTLALAGQPFPVVAGSWSVPCGNLSAGNHRSSVLGSSRAPSKDTSPAHRSRCVLRYGQNEPDGCHSAGTNVCMR